MTKKAYIISIGVILSGFVTGPGISCASEAANRFLTEGTIIPGQPGISIQPIPIDINVIDVNTSGKLPRSDTFLIAGGGDRRSKGTHSWKGRNKGYRNRGSKDSYKRYKDKSYKNHEDKSHGDSTRYKTKSGDKYYGESEKYKSEKQSKFKDSPIEAEKYESDSGMKKEKGIPPETKEPLEGEGKSKPAVE